MATDKWEKRNEEYVNEIGNDNVLSDEDYCAVLEDLVDRAQTALDAKQGEMDEENDEDDEEEEEDEEV